MFQSLSFLALALKAFFNLTSATSSASNHIALPSSFPVFRGIGPGPPIICILAESPSLRALAPLPRDCGRVPFRMQANSREIPKRSELIDYNYAVAGHAGTLCDPDGELFIKPCTQHEVDFYQSALADHPAFADLMPLFMGTLLLNDTTDINDINEQLPAVADHISQHMKEEVVELAHKLAAKSEAEAKAAKLANPIAWKPNSQRRIATNQALVLENSAYGYVQPNILDVKLGQRLWADDAPEEKKKRFDQIRQETTHNNLGFRIAGMRVFRGSENIAELDREEYKIYDKNYGRFSVNDDNVVDAFRKFIFNNAADVDEETGKIVAGAFKADLEHVRDVLEAERSRMYSASLLFVFEGNGRALQAAVEETSASARASEKRKGEKPGDGSRSNIRVDSGIDMGEDGEIIIKGDGEEESEEENLPRIYGLKLIDFAHARWVSEEEGPDENVLLGVRSLIKIFDELSM